MAESTIRQRDWEVGAESVGRVTDPRYAGGDVTSSEDGHGMVSRLLQAWGDNLCPRSVKVWWKRKLCPVSVNGSGIRQQKERR